MGIRAELQAQTVSEVADLEKRIPLIIQTAQDHLSGSALVQPREFTPQDVESVRNFFVAVAPLTLPKLVPCYWTHVTLAGLYSREIASYLKDEGVNPDESEARGLVHDWGRIITPDRYFRNDVLAGFMERKIGVRKEFADGIVPVGRYVGVHEPAFTGIESFTLDQKVNHVADNFGKLNSAGQLVTETDIRAYRSAGYFNEVWPSEIAALAKTRPLETWMNETILANANYLQEVHGVDLEAVRDRVNCQYRSGATQRWLAIITEAQTSALVPA